MHHEEAFIYARRRSSASRVVMQLVHSGIPSRDLEFPLRAVFLRLARLSRLLFARSPALSLPAQQLNNANNSLLLLEYPASYHSGVVCLANVESYPRGSLGDPRLFYIRGNKFHDAMHPRLRVMTAFI